MPLVVRMRLGNPLTAVRQPAFHQRDLVLLRDLDALGQQRDVRTRSPRSHQFGHLQGLGVVRDHALDERHVGSGGLWGLQLRRLVLGEDTVRAPGGGKLHDPGCVGIGVSCAADGQQENHRKDEPVDEPHGAAIPT